MNSVVTKGEMRMRCPDAKELRPFVQKGVKKRQKQLLKDVIDSIKYATSKGKDCMYYYLIDYEEDGLLCADYLKKHGYATRLEKDVLGTWTLFVNWGC